MKKWNLLETATTPDGQELKLFEHDGDYSIRIRGIELMSTRQKASEEKLAELGCAGLREKKGARVLIGGLGFGFTLRAVLSRVAYDAKVVVAELMPAVVAWNRNATYPLAAGALRDPRVEVRVGDVGELIENVSDGFDCILLDVDNGPSALTLESNHKLYELAGLKLLHKALRADGCACIWSVDDSSSFSELLRRSGFQVQTVQARAHATSGGFRTIFVGRKG
ncbi:hypothetical protein K2X33_11750 [bacterium]|nr:hypothetical protein [bacterium]